VNPDDLLHVDPLERLLQRRSAKWQAYPRDVLPLTVAEMDFALAPPVSAALRDAVERSDAGYAMAMPGLGQAVADVGVGVVELLRAVTRPGDAVVISPPVYPPFFDWVPEAGARILEVPLAERDGRQRMDLDNEARELFLRNGKVALEPGLRYGAAGAGYARLNFATSVDILDQATKGMARALAC
jgi:bifunctional pyridoxal-dependent enzyme with beta-cystathionase and maltose regulon repressor activities